MPDSSSLKITFQIISIYADVDMQCVPNLFTFSHLILIFCIYKNIPNKLNLEIISVYR